MSADMSGRARIRRGPVAADKFAIIARAPMRDSRLSRRARGFLAELLTHTDGWETSVAQLVKGGPEGRDAVNGALNELEALGYLVRSRVRDEGGHLAGTEYYVTDDPENPWWGPGTDNQSQVTTSENDDDAPNGDEPRNTRSGPDDGKPVTGKPVTGEPHPKERKDQETRSKGKQKTQNPAVPPSRSDPHVSRAAAPGAAREAKITATERKILRRALRSMLPAILVGMLPSVIPNTVVDAYADVLNDRDAVQIAARIDRRWSDRYTHAATMGTIERPIGVAMALFQRPECSDIRCEDGLNVDTGAPCARCIDRAIDRREAAGSGAAAPPAPADDDPTYTPPPWVTDADNAAADTAHWAQVARAALRGEQAPV